MTKVEYHKARRLIRENGDYAIRWFGYHEQGELRRLREIQMQEDPLQHRASCFFWNSGKRDYATAIYLTTWISHSDFLNRG